MPVNEPCTHARSLTDPRLLMASLIIGCFSCGQPAPQQSTVAVEDGGTKLEVLDAKRTGITFVNKVIEDDSANYFRNTYMYNGGGVASGDLDNDGLPDLAFVSNRNGGAIYHNEGDLKFKDVSAAAGFDVKNTWCTGITMVDVNADGLLDIYICTSGPQHWPAESRVNKLYINKGKMRFEEEAAAHGLAYGGHTTMAYFADMDGDSDLDAFLVGHRTDFQDLRQAVVGALDQPLPDQTDRLFLNDGSGHFTDRTQEANLMSRRFGLGAAVGDLNGDQRNDIYVTNDFYTADMLCANQGNSNGVPHFEDRILEDLRHITYFSMGVDRADFNNDGLPDLYVVDMTPSDHKLNKENMASMRPDQFWNMVKFGMHYQYMVNTLQMNNGDGTFSEIGQMAGVDRTDWSWSPLFVDLDNDGWKDIYVTNGIERDVTNSDFKTAVRKIANEQGTNVYFQSVLDLAPSHVPEKMVFRNKGDLTFEKAMDRWDYHHLTKSTGATYADLDADGDMDLVLVVNDAPAQVVCNRTRENKAGHYAQFVLKGGPANPSAIGSSATLYQGKGKQLCDLFLGRGFQSSVEPLLHFGCGAAPIDSVVVTWYDGTQTVVASPAVDSRMEIFHDKGPLRKAVRGSEGPTYFSHITAGSGLDKRHVESEFNDFASESLLPNRQSQHGPGSASADVNGDAMDDLFVSGAAGSSGTLYVQDGSNHFTPASEQPWSRFKTSEFIGAHFFDADGDHDMDLYLAAGSTEFGAGSNLYQDRLFLNDGRGRFSYAENAIPEMATSTQAIASSDLDGDGDLDLFIGGRNEPGAYPAAPRSHVFINTNGRFSDGSATWLGKHDRPGMITQALFADIDADKRDELVLCGEWMSVQVWKNNGSTFTDISSTVLDTNSTGWWYGLAVNDLDNDGDMDILAGNLGLNNKFHPSKEHPLKIYMSDFDRSNSNDIVLAKTGDHGELPVRGRECSSGQMPFIQDKFPTYKEFANASLENIYGREDLAASIHYQVTDFRSMLLRNDGGKFIAVPLPTAVQISPIRSFVVRDVNGDGKKDILLAGNMFGAEVETTRYDAGIGMLLLGDGAMGFTPVPYAQSGLSIPYDTRDLLMLRTRDPALQLLVAANNNGPLSLFSVAMGKPLLASKAR